MLVMSDCPMNMAVSPTPSPMLLVNTTLRCSSSGGAPSPSYYWLNGTTSVSVGAMVTVSGPGPFFLTCVANSSFDGISCINTLDVSGTAVLGWLNVSLLFTKTWQIMQS